MRKTAIVTGGSRGIGYAVAMKLADEGYNLVLFSRTLKDAVFSALKEKGTEYLLVAGDISKSEDRKRLLDEAVSNFGRVDVLVNDAGVAPIERNDILKMTEESYDRVMTINTKGNMFMTQIVANQMIRQEKIFSRKGTIINISSCSATVSSPNRAEYCVSKAGISMLTTLYADRLAGEDILVHEIRPGVIETKMTETVKEKYNRLIKDGVFPIARWGKPEDIAHVVAFMVSDDFNYTTGDYVNVDGGFHIQRL